MAYKINDDCTACGTCIDECPVEAISEGDIYKIDPDVCTDCGACVSECPVSAIFYESQLPEAWKAYQALNAEMAPLSPNISQKQLPLCGS